jgi:hypothetical protein
VAALVAAALVVVGSVVLLFVSADDFCVSFTDRLGVATSVLTFTLPVLLVVALVLPRRRRRADGRRGPLDDAAFDLVASVVGATTSVLLLGRLLADLVGGDGAPLAGFGVAGRLGTFFVDLAALTDHRRLDLVVPGTARAAGGHGDGLDRTGDLDRIAGLRSLAWWRRRRRPTSPPTFRPPPPEQRWGQPPPPG